MAKSNKRIQIVRTTTRRLSSLSRKSSNAILKVLAKNFYIVGVTEVNNYNDLQSLLKDSPDFIFLGVEYIPADNIAGLKQNNRIWISDFLDKHGIAYTGSTHAAHKLGRDKSLAKQRVLDAGLSTSAYMVVAQNQKLLKEDVTLKYPIFVKPTNSGGGLGINSESVVHDFDQLQSKVNSIAKKHHKDSILEEYLPGREFSTAILKDAETNQYKTMSLELIAPADKNGSRLLSNKVKTADAEKAVAIVDQDIKSRVDALAIDVFHALGVRDYGRIDIRLDSNGTPQFLEANLMPSLIEGYGSFQKACFLNAGLDYESMIMAIVKLGMSRPLDNFEPYQNQKYPELSYSTPAHRLSLDASPIDSA